MEINIIDFLRPELLFLPVFLYLLGMVIKKAPNIPDWTIIFILAFVGMVLAPLYLWLVVLLPMGGALILTGIIQGFFAACIAVFGNQALKQAKNAMGIDSGENTGTD